MLEQILDYIHNYFEKEVHTGSFKIESGSLNVDFLQDGQYFKIIGSVFNDGIYKYPTNELADETFIGSVVAMAVPPAVIAISKEAEDWMNKYGSIVNGPYQSESFGGYSYSRATASNGSGTTDWRYIFGNRLERWRKIG